MENLTDNKILINENSNIKTSIASLTKIMTVLVAIENNENYEKKVTITSKMFKGLAEENLYQVGLRVGQTLTINDLLYATFLSSGADATRALTSDFTEEEFINKMNGKAKELKLVNTHFTNNIGIDNELHYSTLEDLSKLLKNALKNKKFKEIFETKKYTFSDNSKTIYSSITKIGEFYNIDTSNIIGGKTGYTLDAGRCLASIALDNKNNIKYMLITTNAKNNPEHILDATKTYDYYFKNYKHYEIVNKNKIIKTIKTKYSKTKKIELKIDKNIEIYHDKTFDEKLIKIEYDGLELVKPNDLSIGTIKIYYDKKLLYKKTFKNNIKFSLLEFIKNNFIYILIILNIIILIFKKFKKKSTSH